jgi:hypothetical protein
MRSIAPDQRRGCGSPAAKSANFTLDEPQLITRIAPLAAAGACPDRVVSAISGARSAWIAIEEAEGLLIGGIAGLGHVRQRLGDISDGRTLALDQRVIGAWSRIDPSQGRRKH